MKSYKDVVPGRTVSHAVRNRQKEYKSGKGKNTPQVETMCGRHVSAGTKPQAGKVSCAACIRALDAA